MTTAATTTSQYYYSYYYCSSGRFINTEPMKKKLISFSSPTARANYSSLHFPTHVRTWLWFVFLMEHTHTHTHMCIFSSSLILIGRNIIKSSSVCLLWMAVEAILEPLLASSRLELFRPLRRSRWRPTASTPPSTASSPMLRSPIPGLFVLRLVFLLISWISCGITYMLMFLYMEID